MNNNPLIMTEARKYLGLKEVVGAKHSPWVLSLFRKLGHGWVTDDETPWCAAFVGYVLTNVGLPSTRKLNARSYLDWGVGVKTEDAVAGDVVVFWRGSPNSANGHVAFFHSWDQAGNPRVLGGNQSNQVCVASYAKDRILHVRRAK